jgi:hypothetical protein
MAKFLTGKVEILERHCKEQLFNLHLALYYKKE